MNHKYIKSTVFTVVYSLFLLSSFSLKAAETAVADLESGKFLAASKCARCHGESGISSDDSDTPHLAAQNPQYLLKQMKDYKSKVRKDKNMYKRVRKISEQKMINLAAYYASVALPETNAELKQGLKTPSLVANGDPSRSIPPCAICHGKDGRSIMGEIPILAGQNTDYLISTMEYFKDGSRDNDPGAAVQTMIKKLSDVEIEAIAKYYTALGGRTNPE